MKNFLTSINGLNFKPLGVAFISSYVPRKCGIATFTKDLTWGINSFGFRSRSQIVALTSKTSHKLAYPKEVKFKIRQETWADYVKAADYINQSLDIDIVNLQHENGIFGGQDGEYVVEFLKLIKKPIVSTLHSISNPTPNRKRILQQISGLSKYVIVMLKSAKRTLVEDYKVPAKKIMVIPHGVPNFSGLDSAKIRLKLKLENRIVMSSINLISEWKGLEYAVGSLKNIVEKFPNFLYLVVGETHPTYVKRMGGYDHHREHLEVLADTLGVSDNIKFINRYVSLEELVEYVAASDIYVTPYLYPQQTSSGALAYALGAGKACISTPYVYAKETLAYGRGMLVPFENSQAIAKSVIKLLNNPDQKVRIQNKAYKLGKKMTWDNIAKEYLKVFTLAGQKLQPSKKNLHPSFKLTMPSVSLLKAAPIIKPVAFNSSAMGLIDD